MASNIVFTAEKTEISEIESFSIKRTGWDTWDASLPWDSLSDCIMTLTNAFSAPQGSVIRGLTYQVQNVAGNYRPQSKLQWLDTSGQEYILTLHYDELPLLAAVLSDLADFEGLPLDLDVSHMTWRHFVENTYKALYSQDPSGPNSIIDEAVTSVFNDPESGVRETVVEVAGEAADDRISELKGEVDGLAELDLYGKLPESQVPDRLSETQLNATFASQITVDGTTTTTELQTWLDTASALGVKRMIGDITIDAALVPPSHIRWDATGSKITLDASVADKIIRVEDAEDITIIGLSVDSQRSSDLDPRAPASHHALYFKNVDGLSLVNVKVKDPLAFGALIVGCTNLYVGNYHTDSHLINQDGIHLFDCDGFILDGVYGSAGDDVVGISADLDDIRNGVVSNVVGTSAHASLIRVNQTDRSIAASEVRFIEDITFSGLIGRDCANKGFSINNLNTAGGSRVRRLKVQGTFIRTARSALDVVRADDCEFDITAFDCGTGDGIASIFTLQPILFSSFSRVKLTARIVGVTDGYDGIKLSSGSGMEIVTDIYYPTAGYASPQACIRVENVNGVNIHDGLIDGGNRGVQVGSSTHTATHVLVGNNIIQNQIGDAINEGGSSTANKFTENDIRLKLSTAAGSITKVGSTTQVRGNLGYLTERKGVATILSGNTSVTVAHGASATPTYIGLEARHAEASAAFVNTIDATNFQIVVTSAVTADRTVMWRADV